LTPEHQLLLQFSNQSIDLQLLDSESILVSLEENGWPAHAAILYFYEAKSANLQFHMHGSILYKKHPRIKIYGILIKHYNGTMVLKNICKIIRGTHLTGYLTFFSKSGSETKKRHLTFFLD
jgi:hypothetical protein